MLPSLTPLKMKDIFRYKKQHYNGHIIVISEDEDSYFFYELYKDRSLGNYAIKTEKQTYYIDKFTSYAVEKQYINHLVINENDEQNKLDVTSQVRLIRDVYDSWEKNFDNHKILYLKPNANYNLKSSDQVAAAKARHEKLASLQSNANSYQDELANNN
ncbi:hypothetical protein [Mycoplasmopsis agassizii]|uniref:Uncharacterized protein n=1 Tax=Mycoplasmopsis agassizii TaxID=33922 RepID=A0ABX4H653_9BACT|nr:hypothetical protein [Mycoplasmopsis agassizii]PAF55374.1 hypothetical protein CJF60_01640 [Mycoplasmopsis agassizii]SMC20561.1 hypothetical protein SAMN02745179_01028 [Mycoplasmopsis agassizii]